MHVAGTETETAMRRLECARPARTATGHARNAGEAVQQLAQLARERQRFGQERHVLIRRIHRIDARLEAMATLEGKLLPMMRQEAGRTNTAPAQPAPPSPATTRTMVPPAPPAPSVRRPTVLPNGLSEVTLQY
jgi:hypothetical protein